MSLDSHLFLEGDRMIDLFCLTTLLLVWLKYSSNVSLLRHIRQENEIRHSEGLVMQLVSKTGLV